MTTAAQQRPRVLILAARYYDDLTDALLAGATRAIEAADGTYAIVEVSGALELPVALALALKAGLIPADAAHARFDGAVALGCVIRGETTHYDIVSVQSSRALMDLATRHGVPLGNGILTVETLAQARERADPDGLDKGGDAAKACLTLIALSAKFQNLDDSR
jgi:6,7-dimethyl-8-ribityllumazine synthase